MQNFSRQLLTEWRRLDLPVEDKTLVAAVSGGADSCALAFALYELRKWKKLNLRFVVAHFNHDLRGEESDADEKFVKDFARKYDFELAFHKERVSAEGNLEQNARLARYKFLKETAESLHAFAVLTAHTLNDQAETFLINLIRGSGLKGLGGMKPIRFLEEEKRRRGEEEISDNQDAIFSSPLAPISSSKILLARPLLSWATREMTEDFCRENSIEFRYDSMNEDLKFSRVRIRKVLIPLLQDFNPKIVETVAKTAFLLRQDFEGFEEKSAEKIKEFEPHYKNGELNLKDLKEIFPSMRRQILRLWLKENRGDLRRLEQKHIEAIERLAFSRKSGKTVELPDGETIVKSGGKLFFSAKSEKKS
ncbi:MAG TPA: tRNA lysidine(34) synthetase TilS [Pyrinomonadaceae bacterium]|nr:tRNA lysidine(34) synthetase TilS [Pyrinomonadaceae bacterium]